MGREKIEMKKIIAIEVRENYRVWLRFDDGAEGEVDLSVHVGKGVFAPWADYGFFRKATVGESGRTLTWPGELDLCADALWLQVTGKKPEDLFPSGSTHRNWKKGYRIDEHRHRFSVWAAARATQRGFSDVGTLRRALEKCGVREFLATSNLEDIDATRFDAIHRHWCMSVVDFLKKAPVRNVTFGRAAKLIAMYLKSEVVLGPGSETAFARIAHPPIDGILLAKLAGSSDVKSEHKKKWAKTKWTKLNEQQYYELVEQLRGVLGHEEPFWKLERFWTVTTQQEFA